MMRTKARWLAASVWSLVFVGLSQTVGVSQQPVIVEPKPKLVPAGRGQKPFDVTRHVIPLAQIEAGGPPRDGIPALVRPHFLAADEVKKLLRDSDRVLGVHLNGEARAYPVRILNWHELVNDFVGGRPILVSW